jgi:hypothetical protein
MKCSGGDPFIIPEKKTFDQHDGNEGGTDGENRNQEEVQTEDSRVQILVNMKGSHHKY